jgi:hypothetical protein
LKTNKNLADSQSACFLTLDPRLKWAGFAGNKCQKGIQKETKEIKVYFIENYKVIPAIKRPDLNSFLIGRYNRNKIGKNTKNPEKPKLWVTLFFSFHRRY